MKKLIGAKSAIAFFSTRKNAWQLVAAGISLLVRGNVSVKFTLPEGVAVEVPDHCELIPVEEKHD